MNFFTPQNVSFVALLMFAIQYGSYLQKTKAYLKPVIWSSIVLLASWALGTINLWLSPVVLLIGYGVMMYLNHNSEDKS